jgi:hypothetical protein
MQYNTFIFTKAERMMLVSRGEKERNSVDAGQKVKMFNYAN